MQRYIFGGVSAFSAVTARSRLLAQSLVLRHRLLRVGGSPERLQRPGELQMHVAVLIALARDDEVREGFFVSTHLHVGAAQRSVRRDRSVLRASRALQNRDRALDLLALEQRVAIHEEQSVVRTLARQPLEQRDRFVRVVRLQQRFGERTSR